MTRLDELLGLPVAGCKLIFETADHATDKRHAGVKAAQLPLAKSRLRQVRNFRHHVGFVTCDYFGGALHGDEQWRKEAQDQQEIETPLPLARGKNAVENSGC